MARDAASLTVSMMGDKMTERKITVENVRVGDLIVDHTYQRLEDTNQVNKIAATYDESLLSVVEVSRRDDGTLVVIDGQQRRAATLKARGLDFTLTCNVHHGLSIQDEARLYCDFQRLRRDVSPLDAHKAHIVARERIALVIENATRKLGLEIGKKHNKDGGVGCVKALREIVVKNPDRPNLVEETLRILHDAWHGQDGAYGVDAVRGVARFLVKYHPKVNRRRVVERLTKYTPNVVRAKAAARASSRSGGGIVPPYAAIVQEEYDKGRRGRNRLEPTT